MAAKSAERAECMSWKITVLIIGLALTYCLLFLVLLGVLKAAKNADRQSERDYWWLLSRRGRPGKPGAVANPATRCTRKAPPSPRRPRRRL